MVNQWNTLGIHVESMEIPLEINGNPCSLNGIPMVILAMRMESYWESKGDPLVN